MSSMIPDKLRTNITLFFTTNLSELSKKLDIGLKLSAAL